MANADVTDGTLESLKEMKALQELDLNGTQVTDAGLKILKELPSLTRLRLAHTKISDQGFQDLLCRNEGVAYATSTCSGTAGQPGDSKGLGATPKIGPARLYRRNNSEKLAAGFSRRLNSTAGATPMSISLDVSASGNARNALFLARACDLAYFGEPEGPAKFRSELGLDAKLISADNTQVYVAENDQAIVVAFRGSEAPTTLDGLKDWLLTNANNYLILPEGQSGTEFAAAGVGARFHRGFLEALAMVWEALFTAVEQASKAKERPLWVTGHSLGGALALLAAWRFNRNFLSVNEIVTFGAPMIGNDSCREGI